MKNHILTIAAIILGITTVKAADSNTVEIVFSGTTATVTVASNISSYITDNSNGSSHVKLTQSEDFTGNTIGEITYILSGTSTDGEFYLEGSYKCTLELNGLTLTNPAGPAINIQNGKRIKVSAQNGTTNTLTDGANEDYNGCLHCKGHTEFKGKGVLNVIGNAKHAIYSKEYIEIKNLTLNVTSAVKDGIHCKEYFFMESGTVNIDGVEDDAIQVELDSNSTSTGEISDHEDENSGNFYQVDGTLTIGSYNGKAIKADGTISFTGGTRNFDTSDITENASTSSSISHMLQETTSGTQRYDLQGRSATAGAALVIEKKGNHTVKKFNKK